MLNLMDRKVVTSYEVSDPIYLNLIFLNPILVLSLKSLMVLVLT